MKKLLVLFLLGSAACATDGGSIKTYDQNSPVSVNDFFNKKTNVVIKLKGSIENETQNDLQNIMADVLDEEHKSFTIELNSSGGSQQATDMINNMFYMFKKEVKGVTVTTLVKNGSECNSGCTALFVLGDKRVAEKGAIFAFHYGTGGGSASKYYNNISTFKQIIELCGTRNKIVDAFLDDRNIPLVLKAEELKKICPAYINEIK